MATNIPEQFIERLKAGRWTADDQHDFAIWAKNAPQDELEMVIASFAAYYQDHPDQPSAGLTQLENKIEAAIDNYELTHTPRTKTQRIFAITKSIAAAAVVLLVLGMGLWTFLRKDDTKTPFETLAGKAETIVPGGNHAMLTMGNGKRILLDDAKNGVLITAHNVAVLKDANGQLTLDASKASRSQHESVTYNTISTPRGGQYKIILADGTHVWLNAESSLRFPLAFNGPDRTVELKGEAYFEVSKDRARKFKVKVNNTEIQVFGTHFNIMAYPDEAVTKTTLLEGSVSVISSGRERFIVPGQQAIVSTDIKVRDVNVLEAVEWKNGNFNFAHERIESIMRKISRWYDVKIEYQGRPTEQIFIGTLPRSKDIHEVLKYLQLTDLVHFKIEGRSIIVMP